MAKTNFSLREIGFIKESSAGVSVVSPKLYNLGVMGISLGPTQKTEINTEMGQDGQATAMDTGSKDYAGNINTKLKTALMPILLHCVAGESNREDATSDIWTAGTTYLGPVDMFSAGQLVNHSDGIHTLVAKSISGLGTSGATEPNLTGAIEYSTIVDNEITWLVRKKLYKHTGSTDMDMKTVGVYCVDSRSVSSSEAPDGALVDDLGNYILTSEGDYIILGSSDESFRQYFSGTFFNSLQFSKSSGTIVYKYDMPVVSIDYTDNTQLDWTGITPAATVEIEDKSYSFDDMKVTIGGIQPLSAPEFSLSLNRNVTIEDQVKQGAKDYNVPVLTMDGSLKVKFTKEQWLEAYENPNAEVIITYANRTGDKTILTFPVTKKMLGTVEKSTDKFNYLTIPLSPSGTVNQKTMTYETISSSDW